MGTKWGLKNTFWSPWGPKSPNGDQRGSSVTAPTWNGDLNFSKWGPNGDLILSEMGTKWGPSAAEMGTKWGLKKRIFDKLTKTC